MKRFLIYAVLITTLAANSLLANNAFINAAGNGDLELVKKYIADGVDLNSKHDDSHFVWDGLTALMVASLYGHTEVVTLLINEKADISIKSDSGTTALMHASFSGRTEIIKLLINAKANVNAQNNIGTTALMTASLTGHTEVVKLLINAKANVNAQNNNGMTALMLVLNEDTSLLLSQEKRNEVVKILKAAGAKE